MSRPELIRSISAMREAIKRARRRGTIGLVPTMGALHDGHLSLVRAAKSTCDTVVVSIFVNPTQFGANEDFDRYPRTLESDVASLESVDVDLVFAPSRDEMYPAGEAAATVRIHEIEDRLDGAFRGGHFRGVATVVAKLFNIVTPDAAFFGQKDAAQVAVLRAMVRELNFPVELIVCSTIRESDGLAMSSRNQYLSPDERASSTVLHRALSEAAAQAERGVNNAQQLRSTMERLLQAEKLAQTEYVEVVHPDTLEPLGDVSDGALLAIAARFGASRLIDNLLLPSTRRHACE